MPTSLPMPTKAVGDIFTTTLWNNNLRDNMNKLLNSGHRTLTVAQFTALTGLEGTKGTVAGDEVYLEVDATSGVLWHLVYESGETTYKWRYLGGPALYAEVTASETIGSTGAYVALTTAGPSIALPRAGDYDVNIGAEINIAGANGTGRMSYDIGGTGAVDADACLVRGGTTDAGDACASRPRRKAGLATSTLTAKYKTSAGGPVFALRWMSIQPVRIRHDA